MPGGPPNKQLMGHSTSEQFMNKLWQALPKGILGHWTIKAQICPWSPYTCQNRICQGCPVGWTSTASTASLDNVQEPPNVTNGFEQSRTKSMFRDLPNYPI